MEAVGKDPVEVLMFSEPDGYEIGLPLCRSAPREGAPGGKGCGEGRARRSPDAYLDGLRLARPEEQ